MEMKNHPKVALCFMVARGGIAYKNLGPSKAPRFDVYFFIQSSMNFHLDS
jgi:hypothetical protein